MGKLSMRKITELLRQRYALGRSHREIANSLQISPSTVADYLALVKAAELSWPLPEGMNEEALFKKLFVQGKPTHPSKPIPDWEQVYREPRRKGGYPTSTLA